MVSQPKRPTGHPGKLSLTAPAPRTPEDSSSHRIDEPKNSSTGTRTDRSTAAKRPSVGAAMASDNGRGATTPGPAVSGPADVVETRAGFTEPPVMTGSALMGKSKNQGVPAGLAPGSCGFGVGVAPGAFVGEALTAGVALGAAGTGVGVTAPLGCWFPWARRKAVPACRAAAGCRGCWRCWSRRDRRNVYGVAACIGRGCGSVGGGRGAKRRGRRARPGRWRRRWPGRVWSRRRPARATPGPRSGWRRRVVVVRLAGGLEVLARALVGRGRRGGVLRRRLRDGIRRVRLDLLEVGQRHRHGLGQWARGSTRRPS